MTVKTIAIQTFHKNFQNQSKVEYDFFKDKMIEVKPKYGDITKISAKADITHHKGNSQPYFHITGDVRYYPSGEGGGCIHDLIAEHFPELTKYIKWHGVGIDQPMYYLANGLYHLEQNKPEYFKKTVVWGTVEGDKDHEELLNDIIAQIQAAQTLETEKVKKRLCKEQSLRIESYLRDRLPDLMKHFRADMKELFGDQIEWVKVEKLPYQEETNE